MSKIIDISVVFDTVTIEERYGEPSQKSTHPTGINHQDVYMIATKSVVQDGTQASADLTINALVDDSIRWRSESLSGNSDKSAIIYKIQKFGEGTLVTSEPEVRITHPDEPIPNLNDPASFSPKPSRDVYMTCDVLRKGTEKYKVWFYLVDKDENTGELKTHGYYYWDPTIHVRN